MAIVETPYGRMDPATGRLLPKGHDDSLPPAIVVGANAGTGASATLGAGATDVSGTAQIVTGSAAWAVGTQATITFGTPYSRPPEVSLTPGDGVTAAAMVAKKLFAKPATNGSGFTIEIGSGGTLDSATATYNFIYHANPRLA